MALAMAGWLLTRYLVSEFFNLLSTLYTLALDGGGGFRGGTQEIGGQDAFRGTSCHLQKEHLQPLCRAVSCPQGVQCSWGGGYRDIEVLVPGPYTTVSLRVQHCALQFRIPD